jgi:DNA-binding CsgD family transcriptional regulator
LEVLVAAGVPMAAHPSWQGRAAALTDRHAERDALDRLIEAVRAGEAGPWWCAVTQAWARPYCWITWPGGPRELTATGEKVRKRRAERRDQLTPQEEQIARLARDGRTNSDIGAQLFLSARTVEWHLRKIFTKLGIGSRHELKAALAQRGQPAGPPS